VCGERIAERGENSLKLPSITRRDFVRLGASAVAAGAAVKATVLEAQAKSAETLKGAAKTKGRSIRFVSIGTGIRGCDLLRAARQVPNGVCVGSADIVFDAPAGGQRGVRSGVSRGDATIAFFWTARMWMP
jgi:hypothetical protein